MSTSSLVVSSPIVRLYQFGTTDNPLGGAGGGPLASRLAREGHSTLLIEAGDDQSSNPNTTVPIFQCVPKLRKKHECLLTLH